MILFTPMYKKNAFHLVASTDDINEPVTKFGGQPFWIAAPHWPYSSENGSQMRFLAQVALTEEIFPGCATTIVYLFFDPAWEPVGGEAIAAVVQRGADVYLSAEPTVVFGNEAQGPTLLERDESGEFVANTYRVILDPVDDEVTIPLNERYTMDDLDYQTGFRFTQSTFAGNKIGGQPMYIGQLSIPPEPFTSDAWKLLLQLAPQQGYYGNNFQPNFYPFLMELGEFGILSVFISADYTRVVCMVEQP